MKLLFGGKVHWVKLKRVTATKVYGRNHYWIFTQLKYAKIHFFFFLFLELCFSEDHINLNGHFQSIMQEKLPNILSTSGYFQSMQCSLTAIVEKLIKCNRKTMQFTRITSRLPSAVKYRNQFSQFRGIISITSKQN